MKQKIKTLKTDRFTMDYFEFGHGKGTFVILPGLSVQSVMGFADIVADAYSMFEDDYTIYVFDRRNELPASYSVYEMARDTVEAFRTLGLVDVDLFGASQGGMIAMEMAIGHPDLIRKLIIGSASACVDETQYRTIEKWVGMAKAGEKTELYLAFGESVYPKDIFEQSRGLLAEAAGSVNEEDLRRFVILAEGTKGFDVTNNLKKITCPVLVIGSEDDMVLGPYASVQIAKHLGNRNGVVLYMYDGCGHAAYDTAPDYKERILRFL